MGNNNIFVEKSLKRYIKSKKIGYTTGLLIGFLITGNIVYGENVSVNNIEVQIKEIQEKIEENNKRINEINQKTVELLKEGDYYVKTLEDNRQFFFPINYEHRHASKGNDAKAGNIEQEKPIQPEIPDKIEVVDPMEPTMPEKDINDTEVGHIGMPDVKDPKPTFPNITIKTEMKPPQFSVSIPDTPEINVVPIEVDKFANIPHLEDNNIKITKEDINVEAPGIFYAYNPDYANAPELFDVPKLEKPTEIHLPDIKINATKFGQGRGGVLKTYRGDKGNWKDTKSVIENYGKYNTDENGVTVTFSGDEISYGNKEGFIVETTEYEKTDGTIVGASELTDDAKNKFRKDYLSNESKIGTFISHTMDKDADISGKYNIKYTDEKENKNYDAPIRIFLSVNMAGLGLGHSVTDKHYNAMGTADGNSIYAGEGDSNSNISHDGNDSHGESDIKISEMSERYGTTVTFDGELNLSNTSKNGTLVGIDHQLVDDFIFKKSDEGKGYLNTFSIFKNNGIINLGANENEKNFVGITIETESEIVGNEQNDNPDDQRHSENFKTLQKKNNHATINANEININGKNSIGISYETGQQLANDLYVGNVNLKEKSSDSYGVRMKNVYRNNNDFKDLTKKKTKRNLNHYDNARIFGSTSANTNLNSEIARMVASKIELEQEENKIKYDAEKIKELTEKYTKEFNEKYKDTLPDTKVAKSITVNGANNGGFVIAQSLSDSAERYLKEGETPKYPTTEDYMNENSAVIKDYIGYFNKDLGENFEGFKAGEVNPIANIHGLNIEVNGDHNVGFLRHKDYSINNANDMIITNEKTGAIDKIDFGTEAKNSVLIRSDMYGINLEKDLEINGDGIENKNENGNGKAESQEEETDRNVILQATKTTWVKDDIPVFYKKNDGKTDSNIIEKFEKKKVTSVGHVINSAKISSNMDNIIGMMASNSKSEIKPEDENLQEEYLNDYHGYDKKEKATIINNNELILTGKNVVGMAVLDDSLGILKNGKIDTTMAKTPASEDDDTENISGEEKKDYNVSIYNDGTFEIENSSILTSGEQSVAVYNTNAGEIILQANGKDDKGKDKVNNITANDGAIALYSKGGTITSSGKINIHSENNGIGIYAVDKAQITIGDAVSKTADGETNEEETKKDNIIIVENGQAGIASVGEGSKSIDTTMVTLNNTDLTYSGNGYALYTEGNGKINVNDSKIHLGRHAVGMKLNFDGTQANNENISLKDSEIHVSSDDVVVFNIVSEGEQKFESNLSELKGKIEGAVGSGNLGFDIKNDIKDDTGRDLFKVAMVDGETLNIDKGTGDTNVISRNDTDGIGYFYFRKFLGQRLNINVAENMNIDATLNSDIADKFYSNKVTGLEIVSSKYAKNNSEAALNLKKGATVTANRTQDKTGDPAKKAPTVTVGVFGNYATLNLEEGSTINVEKTDEKIGEDKQYEGVGVYAVNGSTVNANGNINVYGDNAVGIYAKSYRNAAKDSDEIIKDEFGESAKGQGKFQVTNNGVIDVSNGDGTIGIYGYNNNPDTNNQEAKADNGKVLNAGEIKVGTSKTKSSIGIYGVGSVIENNGTIEMKEGTEDINGIGIYAGEHSVVKDVGTIKLSDKTIGVVVDETSKIELTDKKVTFEKSDGKAGTSTGFLFQDEKGTNNSNQTIDFDIDGTDADGIRVLATKGQNIVFAEGKTIDIGNNNSRGIIVQEGKGTNKGTINIKQTDNVESGNYAIGMTAMGKDGEINNDGTININSSNGIGRYVNNERNGDGNVLGNTGTININGNNGVGVYVNNGTFEAQQLNLKEITDSISFGKDTQNATGLYVKGGTSIVGIGGIIEKGLNNNNVLLKMDSGLVKNLGELIIFSANGDDNTNRPIGIVLGEKARYRGEGVLKARHGAIGMYAMGERTFENLNLVVDAQDRTTIGLALKGDPEYDTNNGNPEGYQPDIKKVTFTGNTNLTLQNSLSEQNDDKKADVQNERRNAIGMITENTELNVGNLLLNYTESDGIGIYLKTNSKLNGGTITIDGTGEPVIDNELPDYSIGVYVDDDAVKEGKVDFIINKNNTVGLYNNNNYAYDGKIEISAGNAIGIYSNSNITLSEKAEINVSGKNNDALKGFASAGVYIRGNDDEKAAVTNKGSIAVQGLGDIGILAQNANVKNEGKVETNNGTGVFISGKSESIKDDDKKKEVWFDGTNGTITANGKDATGITVMDGATIKGGVGTLNLTEGANGIYVENSVIDGALFSDENKTDKGGNIDVSKSGKNTIAIVAKGTEEGTTALKNLDIKIGETGTGIYALNDKMVIDNIAVSSKADDVNGIYLSGGNKSESGEDINKNYTITNSDIRIRDGFGIIVDNRRNEKNEILDGKSTLDLSDSVFVMLDDKGAEKLGAAVYVGENNQLNSSKNDYMMINNVGIYGTKGSVINIAGDTFGLVNNATGVFSNGGTVKLDKDTEITATFEDINLRAEEDKKDESNSGAVYVINGTIESGAKIAILNDRKSYGLVVRGNGTIENSGDITLSGESNMGIAFTGGTVKENTITNNGKISVNETGIGMGDDHTESYAIYSEGANVINNAELEINGRGIGIYLQTSGKNTVDVTSNGKINLAGSNELGAYLTGNIGTAYFNEIIGKNVNNIGVYAKNFDLSNIESKSITANKIDLGNDSVGMYLSHKGGNSQQSKDKKEQENIEYFNVNIGSITVGDTVAEDRNAIGVIVEGSDIKLNITDKIQAGANGTAIFNQNGNIYVDSIEKLSVGKGTGAIIHNDGGTFKFDTQQKEEDITLKIDGHYGFILGGGKVTAEDNLKDKNLTLEVLNKGTGIVFGNPNDHNKKEGDQLDVEKGRLDIGLDTIKVVGGSNSEGYTTGVYYQNLGELKHGEIIDDGNKAGVIIEQTGMNTIGVVFDRTSGEINTNINLTSDAKNSIGMVIRKNEHNMTTVNGNITVMAGGVGQGELEKFGNVGLEVFKSDITTHGKITVGEGHNFTNSYPVGIYLKNEKENPDGSYDPNASVDEQFSYTRTGKLEVGNFATGIAGRNYNVTYNGDIKAGVGAVGIFVENIDYKQGDFINTTGSITIGDESEEVAERIRGTGIYGKNTDIIVDTTNTAGMTILANEGNIGIVGIGAGDITYKGDVNIAGNLENTNIQERTIIGIYQSGSGKVSVSDGTWNIGANSLGIVAKSKEQNKVAVDNAADMILDKGAIGIYSLGSNDVINSGNISVEKSAEKNKSSVGIYMENEDTTNKSVGTNTGTITVKGENSVGVQAIGNVEFSNEGTINVFDGATGMFAVEGAALYNGEKGIINLGEEDGTGSDGTIGMYAKGQGSFIINEGIINANNGVGMYVTDGATLINDESGDINLKNGIGIKGDGELINKGTITVEKGYFGTEIDENGEGSVNSFDDIIKIDDDVVIIGDRYTGMGGTLNSDLDLNLKNPTIDITAGNGLGFNAPNISGGITATPDFIQKGNGYSFDIKDFTEDNINLDINTSPLYDGNIVDGDLSINKVDYKDILKDYEYKDFYNSLDDTLRNGVAEDIDALKNLNTYLESGLHKDDFYGEYERIMGDARGNIYSHVQSRIQDINRTFDNSFDEMEQSYNLSKDTDKYSIIYTNGDYKNHRTQIPNYDYNIAGILYMKEFEGTEFGNKYGYSYGFTGSKFKFADMGGSEENIYSLRGGVHNVKAFNEDLDLLTKLEIGVNYHETDRTLAFGAWKYEANSDFLSYYVSFDNKFRKILYENYQNNFGAYAGFEFEYGRFTDIKEDGTLALKIKGNDYLSAKAAAGFNGTVRKYLGNDWSGKITGDIGYSYDFGHNYKENESKLKNSNSDYISLMSEIETRGKVTGKIGIGAERLNYMGVTLEGEVSKDFERDEDYWRVGLRFNYKFNSEDAVTTLKNTFNLFENHFDFDKSNLKRKEQDIISAGSKIIDKYNLKGTLVIEGHTDSFGSVEYNQGLSERRAESVKNELQSQIKKPENIKYKTKGYSELKPVDTNETKEGRANNRRVEVKYIPDNINK